MVVDIVEHAGSGHPGAPLGMADIATVLWRNYLVFDPENPHHNLRDRVIFSNGHASALLYAVLYLSGYPVQLEDLKQFRTLGSRTPGHPEKDIEYGIETTSGPLGQGFANALGIALARDRLLSENKIKRAYSVYTFVGDGCLMEGISHEVASLAGTLGTQKFITLYDANQISIDGNIEGWFTEDVAQRFKAYGWHVIDGVDGHDFESIHQALADAQSIDTGPVLVIFKTIIGKGIVDWAGQAACHGQPLGPERYQRTVKALGGSAPFKVPSSIKETWLSNAPGLELDSPRLHLEDNTCYTTLFEKATNCVEKQATRKASQWVLSQLEHTGLMGGSADLSASNLTMTANAVVKSPKQLAGNYIHYGVREFAMAAIANGMALDRVLKPFVATFLVFSDYARSALRMSALMELPVIYVLTHDSIGLGEDGPTHQPVEHLAMLRATPNLNVWRPCDIEETVVAWELALKETRTPSCIVLSRQSLPALPGKQKTSIERGGYALKAEQHPDCVIVATGSEVAVAMEVGRLIENQHNKKVLVVSMPCMETFAQQSKDYQKQVIPEGVPVCVVEAATAQPWYQWAGPNGLIVSMDEFGLSAKGPAVLDYFGFSVDKVYVKVCEFLMLQVAFEESERD